MHKHLTLDDIFTQAILLDSHALARLRHIGIRKNCRNVLIVFIICKILKLMAANAISLFFEISYSSSTCRSIITGVPQGTNGDPMSVERHIAPAS